MNEEDPERDRAAGGGGGGGGGSLLHPHTHRSLLDLVLPYGLVGGNTLTVRDPRIWGSLKSELFAGIMHIWYKIVPKTKFKRESFVYSRLLLLS